MLDLSRVRVEIERSVQPKKGGVEVIAKGRLVITSEINLPPAMQANDLPTRLIKQDIWEQAYREPREALRALLQAMAIGAPTATYAELVRILEMLTCR